jgi:ABC-type transport system involved in cytochrome c biogenesis ATPase subunit
VAALEALVAGHCAKGGLAVVSTHLALNLPGQNALALAAAGARAA